MSELKNMADIPIGFRENIGVSDMEKYINGGLCIGSQGENGVHLYIPYGIWCDIFKAIDSGQRNIAKRIYDLECIIRKLNKDKPCDYEFLIENMQFEIDEIKKHRRILSQIYPIVHSI